MIKRDLIRQVKRLELVTRRKASSRLAGEYHSVFKGRGIDFNEVQPYSPGDDVRFIDWNVSARTGDLFVKKFVEERELTVWIAVDASSSMRFGSIDRSKAEIVTEIAAVLAFSAIRNNDRVGLLIFSDDVEHFIPAKKGRKHVLRIIRDILEGKWNGQRTDIGKAMDFLGKISRRQAVVFMISDFLSTGFERSFKIGSRRHDVVPVVIEDPLEIDFPEGVDALIPIRDLEDGKIRWLDLNDREQLRVVRQRLRAERAQRDRLFKKLRLDTVPVDIDQPYIDRLVYFFRRRAARP